MKSSLVIDSESIQAVKIPSKCEVPPGTSSEFKCEVPPGFLQVPPILGNLSETKIAKNKMTEYTAFKYRHLFNIVYR